MFPGVSQMFQGVSQVFPGVSQVFHMCFQVFPGRLSPTFLHQGALVSVKCFQVFPGVSGRRAESCMFRINILGFPLPKINPTFKSSGTF